jgi:hypothetical protein
MSERFSVYHVLEPDDPLYCLGSRILGRCLYRSMAVPPPWPLSSKRHRVKAAKYGFHATLVAPFKTNEPTDKLIETLHHLAGRLRSAELGPLELSLLEQGFPALVPADSTPEVFNLEKELVIGLCPFRLPPEPPELARREPLSSRQRVLAQKWGYPYVLEEFRYHLTLGDRVPEAINNPESADFLRDSFMDQLALLLPDELLFSRSIKKICLCRQPDRESFFEIITEFFLQPAPKAAEKTGGNDIAPEVPAEGPDNYFTARPLPSEGYASVQVLLPGGAEW